MLPASTTIDPVLCGAGDGGVDRVKLVDVGAGKSNGETG